MIIIRLTQANRQIRLWAAGEILKANAPYPHVQIIHKPDDKETLIKIDKYRYKQGAVAYYQCVPVTYSQETSLKDYKTCCARTQEQKFVFNNIRELLTISLTKQEQLFGTVALQNLQQQFFQTNYKQLKHLQNSSLADIQNPELARFLGFFMADLSYKQILPPMVTVCNKVFYSNALALIGLEKGDHLQRFLNQNQVPYVKRPDSSALNSIMLPQDNHFGAYTLFDTTAGKMERRMALQVQPDALPKLARTVYTAYKFGSPQYMQNNVKKDAVEQKKAKHHAQITQRRIAARNHPALRDN